QPAQAAEAHRAGRRPLQAQRALRPDHAIAKTRRQVQLGGGNRAIANRRPAHFSASVSPAAATGGAVQTQISPWPTVPWNSATSSQSERMVRITSDIYASVLSSRGYSSQMR